MTKAIIEQSFYQIVENDVIYYLAQDVIKFLNNSNQNELDKFAMIIEKHIEKVADKSMVENSVAAKRYKENQWKQAIDNILKIAVSIQYLKKLSD